MLMKQWWWVDFGAQEINENKFNFVRIRRSRFGEDGAFMAFIQGVFVLWRRESAKALGWQQQGGGGYKLTGKIQVK